MNITRISTTLTIQRWTGTSLAPVAAVTPHTFSAGETHLNVSDPAEVSGEHLVVTVRGGDLGAYVDANVYADALRQHGARSLTLFAPYLPAARQDRGAPFTARIAADLINAGAWDRVIAVDPHSPVMPDLLNNLELIDAALVVPAALLPAAGTITVIAPDKGATARATAVAERFTLPLIVADKHRDPTADYRVTHYRCARPTTDHAVVIDDICDGGGTFMALADSIGMPAEALTLWTTHGIYSRTDVDMSRRYGRIACSNSLPSSTRADLVEDLTPHLTSLLARAFAA